MAVEHKLKHELMAQTAKMYQLKWHEGQLTRRTNDSKHNDYYIVTTLDTIFPNGKAFCCRCDNWRSLNEKKSERENKKNEMNKTVCKPSVHSRNRFLRCIIIHTIIRPVRVSFANIIAIIVPRSGCRTEKKREKKINNKRLKHKRPILSVVLG